ncbi:MAG: gamma-glutamyl-gamma-aminobutyrate hydrolase family protein [Bacilli bacterium]
MKKPIIGIVGRTTTSKSGDNCICSWEEIRLSIIKCGGIPLLILPTNDIVYDNLNINNKSCFTKQQKEDLYSIVGICDGIIFQGGVCWSRYDTIIFNYALSKDVPMLGICAGMQMMACVDKYNSFSDLTIPNSTKINHQEKNKRYVHKVKVIKNTLLYDIVKTKSLNVNSRHNFHIDGVKNFIVSAYSSDGLIEAIEYPNKKFVLGLQWHPESLIYYDMYANEIFLRFLKICKKNS